MRDYQQQFRTRRREIPKRQTSVSFHTPEQKSTCQKSLTYLKPELLSRASPYNLCHYKDSSHIHNSGTLIFTCSDEAGFKGAQSRLNGLKSLAKLFNFVVFQSVSILSILNHPCSFMFCCNLFGVFLSL